MARRPGVPSRRRLAGRLPSLRRILAGAGAGAAIALLVAALNGPWLRVGEVAWAGERYTPSDDLAEVLEPQQGASVLAVDTRSLRQRLEGIPSVERASVTASLTGRLEATVVERQAAFTWMAASKRYIGAADGTIFASEPLDQPPGDELAGLPAVTDQRFVARVVSVGDVIPAALLHAALEVAEIDPRRLGSTADQLAITLDDEYGFRLVSTDQGWEVALGVYGLDPQETPADADARLERQIGAIRTLFASHAEAELSWVDVRNPGKVYFRAKG